MVTSFQSSVTGNVGVAPLDGLTSVGAAGVPVPPPLPGVTVNPATHVVFNSAQTFARVVVPTLVVPTVNVALVAPAGIVTLAGPVAGLHGDICTDEPPDGAGALMVTVAVDVPPATTVDGFKTRDVTQRLFGADGLIVKFALADDGP